MCERCEALARHTGTIISATIVDDGGVMIHCSKPGISEDDLIELLEAAQRSLEILLTARKERRASGQRRLH